MSKLPDFYRLLHVQPDAPSAVVKASYRAMMQKMQHHPDLGGDEAIAQRLNEAVATLCDPAKRAIYDVKLALQAKHLSKNFRDSHKQANSADDNVATAQSESAHHDNTNSKKYQGASCNKVNNKGEQTSAPSNEPPISSLPVKPRCPFCQTSYLMPASSAPTPYSRGQRCHRCNGAVTPISLFESIDRDELRKIHRHQHVTAARLWQRWPTDKPLLVTMSDLSPAGCAIESTANVTLNSVVLLDTELLNAICKVRYCKQLSANDGITVGLEFLTLELFSVPGTIFSSSA